MRHACAKAIRRNFKFFPALYLKCPPLRNTLKCPLLQFLMPTTGLHFKMHTTVSLHFKMHTTVLCYILKCPPRSFICSKTHLLPIIQFLPYNYNPIIIILCLPFKHHPMSAFLTLSHDCIFNVILCLPFKHHPLSGFLISSPACVFNIILCLHF